MVYNWGSVKFPVEAQKAGEEFERIEGTYGMVNPVTVVEESIPEKAVLHECFEWDNSKAGQKWREQQVRVILGNLVTVYMSENEVEHIGRTFVNVATESEDFSRSYLSMSNAISNKDYRKQLLDTAKREFESFRRKYRDLKEFAKIFDEYDRSIKND